MFRLIETIRVADGKVWLIDDHHRRMKQSAHAIYGSELKWNFQEWLHTISIPREGIWKLRLVYDHLSFSSELTPYTIRPVATLKLVEVEEMDYQHKYEDRTKLNELFALRESADDILIVKRGMITDVSYANIALLKDGQWYTPNTYLLNGVMRQHLLAAGKLFEAEIGKSDLGRFEKFRLINAMLADASPASEVSNIH